MIEKMINQELVIFVPWIVVGILHLQILTLLMMMMIHLESKIQKQVSLHLVINLYELVGSMHCGLNGYALYCRLSHPGLGPGQGHCVVFLRTPSCSMIQKPELQCKY